MDGNFTNNTCVIISEKEKELNILQNKCKELGGFILMGGKSCLVKPFDEIRFYGIKNPMREFEKIENAIESYKKVWDKELNKYLTPKDACLGGRSTKWDEENLICSEYSSDGYDTKRWNHIKQSFKIIESTQNQKC